MKFIIGLGNPGKRYEHTRHNLGMRAVKRIASDNNLRFKRGWLSKSSVASGMIGNVSVKLIFPKTFMNVVGNVVSQLRERNRIDPVNFLVICDDVNLELGKVRIKASGSNGGHNGLKSIIQALGTNEFPRLRVGIGRPTEEKDLSEYVLSNFSRKEEEEVTHSLDVVCKCCMSWLGDGITATMSKFN